MEKHYDDLDLDEFKSRIPSALQFISIMVKSESKKTGKENEHLLNIYNKVKDKELFINNLKIILYKLSAMNSIVNNDMNNYNINIDNLFHFYPQFSLEYLNKVDKEQFISWFNVVIKNHISITKMNMIAIENKEKSLKIKTMTI